jgi:DNA-binding CsgD family transcriptional regulator
MGQATRTELSEREAKVLELIGTSRMPQKQIAQELGVSPARIAQHVRDLKQHFSVNTLDELASIWQSRHPGDYNNSLYKNNQVPPADFAPQEEPRNDPGAVALSDAGTLFIRPPWPESADPLVVPEELDCPDGTTKRFVAMLKIVALVLVAVVLGVAVIRSIGDITEGSRTTSAEAQWLN